MYIRFYNLQFRVIDNLSEVQRCNENYKLCAFSVQTIITFVLVLFWPFFLTSKMCDGKKKEHRATVSMETQTAPNSTY